MEWFFVVWLNINGSWIQGDHLDGWSAIEQSSHEACVQKLNYSRELNKNKTDYIRFSCNMMKEDEILVVGTS